VTWALPLFTVSLNNDWPWLQINFSCLRAWLGSVDHLDVSIPWHHTATVIALWLFTCLVTVMSCLYVSVQPKILGKGNMLVICGIRKVICGMYAAETWCGLGLGLGSWMVRVRVRVKSHSAASFRILLSAFRMRNLRISPTVWLNTLPDHIGPNRTSYASPEASTMIVNSCSVSARPLQNIKKLIKHKKDMTSTDYYLHYNDKSWHVGHI